MAIRQPADLPTAIIAAAPREFASYFGPAKGSVVELYPPRQCNDYQEGGIGVHAEWIFVSGHLHTRGIDGGLVMFRDSIVEEVRAIREQLAAECDFDIRKIVAEAQRRQATSKSRIVSFERPPVVAESSADRDKATEK
jgi:hypothetical protein